MQSICFCFGVYSSYSVLISIRERCILDISSRSISVSMRCCGTNRSMPRTAFYSVAVMLMKREPCFYFIKTLTAVKNVPKHVNRFPDTL